jgi:ABC-type multidrug transport system ATPase subunit
VLHPYLTVQDTVIFCAMLCLPRVVATKAVIAELGLAAYVDTVVGNVFVCGVFDGERKRVSIGHELLVNPSLLILDEPTSILDSTAAACLIATLSSLARKGRTGGDVGAPAVVGSLRVYQIFDSMLLLAERSGQLLLLQHWS